MGRSEKKTSFGGSNIHFPTTKWTRMLNPTLRDSIIKELYENYSKPVYCYLLQMGFNPEKSKDLVQSFFTEKILEKHIFYRAEQNRGKFRSFLLTAVKNYVISKQRSEKNFLELNEDDGVGIDPENPENVFNRTWAENLLFEAIEEFKNECQRSGNISHWKIFHACFIKSNIDNDKSSMRNICALYGIKDVSAGYNLKNTVRIRFGEILRRQIRPLVNSASEIDDEIMSYIQVFSKNSDH